MSENITNVPEGWKIQPLQEVCKLRKKTKLPPLREIAHIPMALIPKDGLYTNYALKSKEDIKSGDICKEGDILLAGITPSFENGKQGIVPQLPSKYAITSTEAFPIICDHDVETHFIFHLLKYEFTRRIIASKMEGSTGRRRVPSDVLMNFHIPVPPLIEQRGIIEVLGTVDEYIRLTDKVIDRGEELKQSLIQQLLTKGIKHTEHMDTPLGQIPKTWKLEILQKLTNKITDGTHFTPKYIEHGIAFLRVTDIKDELISWDNVKKISKEEHIDLLKRANPEKGDILLSKNGTVGITKLIDWDKEFSIFVSLCLIKPKHEIINNYFLKYVLSSEFCFRQIKLRSKRAIVNNLHLEEIRDLKIPLPSIEEQIEIVHILQNSDKLISAERSRNEKLNKIKQGLMQQLLSGQIRVELREDGLHRIRDGREAHH